MIRVKKYRSELKETPEKTSERRLPILKTGSKFATSSFDVDERNVEEERVEAEKFGHFRHSED